MIALIILAFTDAQSPTKARLGTYFPFAIDCRLRL